MGDDLYPLAVLVDEMKDDDIQMRLNSVKRLTTIALALGEEKTRSELMPYLAESLEDEDEVLMAVAEELGKFVLLVGGPNHAHSILPPLEALCHIEETVVREKAAISLANVIKEIPTAQLETHVFPVLQRLSSGEWFTSRCSVCSLFAPWYARAPANVQAELRKLYSALVGDETPMVRRAAAANLGALAAIASVDVIKSDMISWVNQLTADEQDSVRVLGIDSCLGFAKVLSKDDLISLILPLIHNGAKDRSWRVRFAVASKFLDFQAAFGDEVTKVELVPLLVGLMRDQEAEVKTQCANKLPEILKTCNAADRQTIFMTNIMPYVVELCSDTSPHVRSAVASVLMALSPILGKDRSLDQIVPLFIRLLKDDNSEVRLNVVAKLDLLQSVIGGEQVSNVIIPEIVSLAEDPQWRVRLAIIEQLPMLAKALGSAPFDSKLTPLCLQTWLMDSVYAVRESAIHHLKALVQVFGLPWARKTVLPKLVAMGSEKAYLNRLTSLLAIQALVPVLDAESGKEVLPVVLKLAGDGVPNVRFNAAKTLSLLVSKLDAGVVSGQVKPCLQKLSSDTDGDVQYYSKSALASC